MESAYIHINGRVAVSQRALVEAGVASVPLWKKWSRINPHEVAQKGGNGRSALIYLQGIPSTYLPKVVEKLGAIPTEVHPLEEFFVYDLEAADFYTQFRFEDGTALPKKKIDEYTLNASVYKALPLLLQARENIKRRSGHSTRGLFDSIVKDMVTFNGVLQRIYKRSHTIKPSRLKAKLKQFKNEGYAFCIDSRFGNQSAAKVSVESERVAILEELIKHPANYPDTHIRDLYNITAKMLHWPIITNKTVANYRIKTALYNTAGRRGAIHFDHTKSMQIKRRAPEFASTYWTLDGWDAELLYQEKQINRSGHNVTTFHNRHNVVVVLDPTKKINYPIGYAIGTHETPDLIKMALKNAVAHMRELFGEYYIPLQLQTDNYGKGKLFAFYELVAGKHTPARARNSKAKVVESYFGTRMNPLAQKMFPGNWSGHNVDSSKNNQPNEEWLNKNRHNFPDSEGARQQIISLIEHERAEKVVAFREAFEQMPYNDKKFIDREHFLDLFGELHTHTCRLRGEGFCPTIDGVKMTFDSFDIRFREMAFLDYAVKYDRDDLSTILVLDAKTDHATRKVSEVIGQNRFMLEQKYIQPMALYDRKDGDAEELKRVNDFNKNLKSAVMERAAQNREVIEDLVARKGGNHEVLSKLMITDSNGQHKDRLNDQRAPKQIEAAPASSSIFEDEIIEDDVRNQYGNTNNY